MLNIDVCFEIISVLATEVTKLTVESCYIMLGLQMFFVLVVGRADHVAARLLTIEGGQFLSLGSTSLEAAEMFLCLVV